MNLDIKGFLSFIFVCISFIASNVLASEHLFTTTDKRWFTHIYQSVLQHPNIVAAKASVVSDSAYITSQAKPIYNPELNADISQEGNATNIQVGIEQTLDWWGKSDVNYQQAKIAEQQSVYQTQQIKQQVLFDILSTLLKWHTTKSLLHLTQDSIQQLYQLSELIEQQYRTGNISYLESQLAQLTQVQARQRAQDLDAEYQQLTDKIKRLLPNANQDIETLSLIPNEFWTFAQEIELINTHDLINVRIKQLHVESQRLNEKMTTIQAKSEPTVGIYTGRTDDENVVGVSISVPLNIRNNYQSTIIAAQKKTEAFQSEYEAAIYQEEQTLEILWSSMKSYQSQYTRLERNNALQNKNYLKSLLDRQLKYHDISLTDYLHQQRLFTELSNMQTSLEQQWKQAYLQYLLASDQLLSIFTRVSGGSDE